MSREPWEDDPDLPDIEMTTASGTPIERYYLSGPDTAQMKNDPYGAYVRYDDYQRVERELAIAIGRCEVVQLECNRLEAALASGRLPAEQFIKIGILHRRRTGDVDFHQEAEMIPLGLHETLDVYMLAAAPQQAEQPSAREDDRRDAERYRWLRSGKCSMTDLCGPMKGLPEGQIEGWEFLEGAELDAAIDAARAIDRTKV